LRLAFRVGVSEKTVMTFKSGEPRSRPLDLGLVRERLEAAGVIFVEENGEGPGVRLRKRPRVELCEVTDLVFKNMCGA
jgi:hypothetical protein